MFNVVGLNGDGIVTGPLLGQAVSSRTEALMWVNRYVANLSKINAGRSANGYPPLLQTTYAVVSVVEPYADWFPGQLRA
jgi:hypothetical protein